MMVSDPALVTLEGEIKEILPGISMLTFSLLPGRKGRLRVEFW